MKKSLLLSFAFFTVSLASAQSLFSENASSLTVGNIGTDMTGVTPGQGGWLTTVTAGANSDFQVVNVGGTNGNLIQITGSNSAVNTRRMFRDVSSVWGSRTAGNDVAQVQFDFFTGPATTSANSLRVAVYNADNTRIIAGMTYIAATRELRGLGYYDNAGTVGNFSFTLGFNGTTYSPLILQPSTWYTLGFSFNKTTGELKFKEVSNTLITAPPIAGASAGIDFTTLNIAATAISTTGQTNSVSAVGQFDNISLRALVADENLLKVKDPIVAADVQVYPNPAVSEINVSSSAVVKSISIADLNGRVVKSQSFSDAADIQVNVSDLSSGIYVMTINGDGGTLTRKIVKQ
ncbi:T9SS type A sorting domain-containing protein [Flavobacterium selenitireducens]|uniref:T9SS type A sorting domain-containing protein n=1 Tax=Flavobacterium selenitireducens TaxID=2722704 RepID=UPI00168B230F|nr:T9SS type A sorting domain-containing protein [Flavobacterium selenitireducens]MBD3580972.1 T9SS type A sorting domain-containing protein [Flavobacterium selenitireducens]